MTNLCYKVAMLSRLSIRDIVLIDRLDIDFAKGLAVLTGETGAGKSILLDSFALALGGRGDQNLVRQGVEQGQVIAVFEVSARHPARAILRTGRHGSGAGLYVGHHKIGWRDQGQVLRLLRDDRYFLPLHRWSEGPSGRVRGPGRGDDGRDVRHSRHPAGRAR